MFDNVYIQTQSACCIVQLVLWFIPVLILRYAMINDPLGVNNSNPRDQYSTLPGYAVRAANAHHNTLEGFVWFAFALIMNLVGDGDPSVATILSIIYTLCRVVYLPLYIYDFPTARTAIWNIGFLMTFALSILPFVSKSS